MASRDDQAADGVQDQSEGPYREIGRRIFAGVLSVQLKLKSVDYALKHYTPAHLHPSWSELGRKLQHNFDQSALERLHAASPAPARHGIYLVGNGEHS